MGPKQDLDTSNRSVSVQGDANAPVVAGDHNTVSTHHTTQNGQVNISAQQVSVHNEIHEPPAVEVEYLQSDELCQNRQALAKYLERTLKTLRQHGCLEFRQDIEQGSYRFTHVARIEDFELPSWPVSMRGEAFFVFSEFSSMHMKPARFKKGQFKVTLAAQNRPPSRRPSALNCVKLLSPLEPLEAQQL